MNVTVATGDPEQAEHLLRASHALMQSLFPAESNHFLPLNALRAPNIHFLIARHNDAVKGCAACKDYPGYSEVKSMFVDPSARGLGIGEALLSRLISDAKTRGVSQLRLETGNSLHAAHRLYNRSGFTDRGPFGDYRDDPLSLFMECAI
jgi:putative acetyltransferase